MMSSSTFFFGIFSLLLLVYRRSSARFSSLISRARWALRLILNQWVFQFIHNLKLVYLSAPRRRYTRDGEVSKCVRKSHLIIIIVVLEGWRRREKNEKNREFSSLSTVCLTIWNDILKKCFSFTFLAHFHSSLRWKRQDDSRCVCLAGVRSLSLQAVAARELLL